MPDVVSGDVAIHYDVAGQGQPLVLHHGFGSSGRDWADLGYVDALSRSRLVIYLDGRGHGRSGKPHDRAAYQPRRLAADVVAVLDDVGVERADFYGYSGGGLVGFALARYAPHRIRSYIIGGASPYEFPPGTAKVMWRALQEGPAGLVGFAETGGPLRPAVRARMLENDIDALKAMFTSGAEVPDSFDDVPRAITSPCLLIVGEDDFVYDGVVKCAQEIEGAVLVTLPNTEHMQGFYRAELSLPHVEQFLAQLDGGPASPRSRPAASDG